MLVSYNDDYEKITMGLLSYISDLKELPRLEKELDWYNSKSDRKIYLWQSEETENFIGVVGVEEEEDSVIIRHIAIDPSYRNEGITYEILDALQTKYVDKSIVSTLETANVISKWQKNNSKNEE